MRQAGISGTARRRRTARDDPQSGFTLVEMLVVIAIIGMIMGLIGPRVLSSLNESRVKTARIQIQSFSSALDLFYLDTGRYPTSSEGLTALVRPASTIPGWAGPYLKGGNVPSDPWSHAYVYRSPGQHVPYEIVSYGSDGQEGGVDLAADISSSITMGAK
ncbi:type II secretion system major pseudopilin GspG [Bradyrhizobium sp. SZCCHNR1093]|uniref:type II secretion system major pseudopilin GspG n=1 Tax=Bradyrhizobium sp. SZCCHNR1093 TaxID=3057368 RepID=UPI0028EDF888|nr:type II secretion system major pseudopilin GspG [Bradyrhizobium sp. SZCCHNR1093]